MTYSTLPPRSPPGSRASRLETGAEPGQNVIGEATHAAIKDAAVVERLGPIEVKGKERPVQAYALTDFRG